MVGKTNLDQFATGLVGVRSPYGAVKIVLTPNILVVVQVLVRQWWLPTVLYLLV